MSQSSGRVNRISQVLGRLGTYFRADIYIRLFPYIWPYRVPAAIVVALSLVQTGFGLLEPWPLKILIDQGLSGQRAPEWMTSWIPFVASVSRATIVVGAVLAGIVLFLATGALDILYNHVKGRVNAWINLRFQADLFSHLQRLSFSYHDRTTVGDSMYRLQNDTGFISVMVWGNFRHLLTDVVKLAAMVWIVVRVDWQLALLALTAAPFMYVSVWLYPKLFMEKERRIREVESAKETIVQEVLSCLRVVKAFGMEQREQERFERQSRLALVARIRLSLEQSLFGAGMGLIPAVNRSLVLLFGGLHVLEGRLTLGELMVILSYIGQIHAPLGSIGETLTDMQLSLVSAERTLAVLDVVPEIRDRPDAKSLERAEGRIAFENASFGYRTGRPVVHDISFTADAGRVVALVGPTGAGKTTIASLIARFYDPSTGRVLLDGHDVRDLTVRTLRENIALVLQEPILFTGSVRDNIAYGRPDASFEDIVAAAKAANAHDFITALPESYDSQAGERGVQLSGGERQRIAVARAFLKNAPVLILDEPTSSVDSRTEQVILDALDRLMLGRTTFIIAHRLSTIRRADQILVVDKGRIVERGSHGELVRADGLYAQLYRLQFGALRQRKARATL